MLINKVSDNDGGRGGSVAVPVEESGPQEYQTANELYELMAKNQHFDTSDVDMLTTRDLVLLYKNIDLGTKLMSNANDLKLKRPNQRVETIVYNDEPESEFSDVSDVYSNEDLHSMFLVNKERLDLLNTPQSVANTLCHKQGDLEIQSSDLTTEYDKHFLFKDPYIKEQLKNLKNSASDFKGAVLPASLLDYICCKRLEDNYNFYMENIIIYVKHTIEQLKRISNGDYLTDKAKEKWREVENDADDRLHTNTKVLAMSTSIPLHVEQKYNGRKSTWDDIVHSAVDIRSLSKILEKKIVVEVPKLLCGPYKILSKCAENLIISCKKDKRPVEERVDVVFQLQRSEAGQVISNISSVMILQAAPTVGDTFRPEVIPLPITYKEQTNDERSPERKPKIMELEPKIIDETIYEASIDSECSKHSNNPIEYPFADSIDSMIDECSDNDDIAPLKNSNYRVSNNSSDAIRHILDEKLGIAHTQASNNVFPDDLRISIRKLTAQSTLAEESGEDMSQSTAVKRKLPARVRIKSPYENKSYMEMEEKKRMKLLEIREKREKKKMALAESCKITKHKYVKGTTMPNSTNSVTKLSISNKSFYNSIYGQSMNRDPKQERGRNGKGGKRKVLALRREGIDDEHDVLISTPDKNKKYINRSCYLDNTVTEMMYMDMKRNESDAKDLCSTSASVISTGFQNNINYLSQLTNQFETDLNIEDSEIFPNKFYIDRMSATKVDEINDESTPNELLESQSIFNKVSSNSENVEKHDNTDPNKVTSTLECRKSIHKIYTLMNKLGKAQETESKSARNKYVMGTAKKVDEKRCQLSSPCQGSDSGTSLKHRSMSSYPSSFSFDKHNNEKPNNTSNQKPESQSSVAPKVITGSKLSSIPKTDSEKYKKDCKRSRVVSPTKKVTENPLKAISQLLREFENVQKTKQTPNTEQKTAKKIEMMSADGKSGSRQSSFKQRLRLEHHNEAQTERYTRFTTKEKKSKQFKEMDVPKTPYQQIPADDKHSEKIPKKKITDILDEVKEARGEAVRGPSKLNSRLNSLAQPKRSYVQAHSEEYQTKYGKNLMADRLQRLAAASPPSVDRPSGYGNPRIKVKRGGSEAVSAGSAQLPPPPVPLERAFRTRHSPRSNPEARERLNQGMGPPLQITNPETPQALIKKMVAVESYVKNHYGSVTSASAASETQSAQKSRVSLLPNDIELASSTLPLPIQDSTELGSRLHNIINTIMKTTSSGLEVLSECQESNSNANNVSKLERMSSESDYVLDILDDNNVKTSVENMDKASENELKQTFLGETDAVLCNLPSFQSATELEKLENAIVHLIPVGNFQKRLVKNITVTPKQSMQQVFLLQAGDGGSLVFKTPTAQNLKETKSENFSDLTALPVLSKSHMDWSFANFPLQISTVGYAFPENKSIQRGSTTLVQLFDENSKKSEDGKHLLSNHKTDQHNQCCKGAQPQLCCEQAAQVDIPAATLVTVGISSTSTHALEPGKKEETKRSDATKIEPKHVPKDFSENKTVEDTLNGEQTQTHTSIGNKENGSVANKPGNIEYTTSLDILVGLLNEIQNITTCQTQITKGDKNHSENQESKEFETILNKAAALENSVSSPCDEVSLTSLDRLRQLESNPSVYSFYLSDIDGSEKGGSKFNFRSEIIPMYNNELLSPKRICVDKEVGVDFKDREAVNKFTDVCHQIFPLGMSHKTDTTNSLGIMKEPSIQSMLSFTEYYSVESNSTSLAQENIINIPQILITREYNQSLTCYEVNNQIIEKSNENKSQEKKIESFEKERNRKRRKVIKDKFSFKTDYDPIMKMKRDVLVTVYSILVFTVFAALSFPEMLYRF